jgi:GNAT superfamily N-acetyltransferase
VETHSIIAATTPEEFGEARRLFEEYQDFLRGDCCFQGFQAELDSLPTMYGPPRGTLLLARVGGVPVGCVGLRDLGDGVAEMKRLYVLPPFQGKGIGKSLTVRFLETAADLGYTAIRLDTVPHLEKAVSLYKKLGFTEIAPYRDNPDPIEIFMEKRLK